MRKFNWKRFSIFILILSIGIGGYFYFKKEKGYKPNYNILAAAQTGCDTVICPSSWQWSNTDNFYIGMCLYTLYRRQSDFIINENYLNDTISGSGDNLAL